MGTTTIKLATLGALACLAAPALADWYPGDGYKMHYPQLPDPYGWDIEFNAFTGSPWDISHIVADDWLCTETGPVSDLHFWLSWHQDIVGTLDTVEIRIFDNDTSGPYAKPGLMPLWSASITDFTVIDPYGTGDQGFYSPFDDSWFLHDHQTFQQINIVDIQDPFIQEAGTTYWLGLYVTWESGTQGPTGWKTTVDPWGAGGVYWDYIDYAWYEVIDPVNFVPLDMAFVITPEAGSLPLLLLGALTVRRRR